MTHNLDSSCTTHKYVLFPACSLVIVCHYPPTALQVLEVLKKSEDYNQRLLEYIDSILLAVIEKHPEILEKS